MKNKHYDWLIIGSGLFGATFANEMTKKGKSCLVVEKRNHIGGNIYCEKRDDINIHLYGAHIFHTSNELIWNYINNFATFNNYINSPIAKYKDEIYNLPFNMNTFYQMWKTITPNQVINKIEEQKKEINKIPENLEEQAISLVGRDIFEKLIKGYTEKQWGRSCKDLPASIIRRLPVRLKYDNNYFNDPYQGIPKGGYNQIIEKMLENSDVLLNTNYNDDKEYYNSLASKVLYTGTLDSLFDFDLGRLEYRSEEFKHERIECSNYQGVAVVNYTEREIPYTRIIEHKHFEYGEQLVSWISYEYPVDYEKTGEPFYPINNEKNSELHSEYLKKAKQLDNFYLGGRLAEYKYYDMDKTIESALNLADKHN